MFRRTKKNLLILAIGSIFLTGSIGCSRQIRVTVLEDEITPVPVGSVLTVKGEEIPVVKPSYLITQDFMEKIARTRAE